MKATPRTSLMATLAGTMLLALASTAPAANFAGHYPSGVEGIKGASLPPPGVYLRDYNLLYWADEFPGGPPGFDAFVYAQVPRLIWMTEGKIFGAQYGMDVLVPFYYADVKYNTPAGRVSDSTFAMADAQFEPLLLAWHLKQFDIGAGYAVWLPTGDYNKDGTRPSRVLPQGFWTHMITAGATWYPDKDKTWALSLLNRYEIHAEHPDRDYTAGHTYTAEWGISKTLQKTIDVGVIGYYQAQVNDDSGAFARNTKDAVVGLGPEVSIAFPKHMLFASLRYAREFAADSRPEGNTVTLTLTKRF